MKPRSKTQVWIILSCTVLALASRLYFMSVAVIEKTMSGDERR
jgi:hypothetical protein